MSRRHKLTPEQYAAKIDEFCAWINESGTRPTDYQLCNFLGLSPDTLERYRKATAEGADEKKNDGDYTNNAYADATKKLTLFCEDWLLRHADANPRNSTIDIFALKQSKNGGWTDKQVMDTNSKFEISYSINGNSADGKAHK